MTRLLMLKIGCVMLVLEKLYRSNNQIIIINFLKDERIVELYKKAQIIRQIFVFVFSKIQSICFEEF